MAEDVKDAKGLCTGKERFLIVNATYASKYCFKIKLQGKKEVME